MTRPTATSALALLAALALAGCGRNAASNYQANASGAPDMASDTGMNTSSTAVTTNGGTADAVTTTTTSNTSGY